RAWILAREQKRERYGAALVHREVRDHPGRKDVGVEAGVLEPGEGALDLSQECVECGHRRECTRAGCGGSTRRGTGQLPAVFAHHMKWAIVAVSLVAACAPVRPQVSLEPGVSLKGYRRFVVDPVTDATGAAFNLSVTDSLRRQLADRLRSHRLTVVLV